MPSTEKSWKKISFVDANIFIHALTPLDPAKQETSLQLLNRMERGDESYATDYLALLEACHRVSLLITKEYSQEVFRKFLSLDALTLIPIGNTLFFEALKNYGRSTLKLADHIHFTAARATGCHQIYSYDKDFDNLDIPRVEP